ncbi:MAG: hypothetical protein IK024_05890 [Treponema sp.]|nr:hypothetical protein [Treponema sp.]
MSLTEFNAEEVTREFIEEGREQKALEAAINLLKMKILTPEQIAQAEGLSLERVLELQKEIPVLV